MKKIICIMLCIGVLLSAALVGGGCSSDTRVGKVISYPLDIDPANIDPQMTSDYSAKVVLQSCMEGLTRLAADGEVVPGVATRWEESNGNMIYTFQLRKESFWYDAAKGAPVRAVTAKDFVFAIQRTLNSQTKSPLASKMYCIKNAKEFYEGKVSKEELGVKAIGDDVLEISLVKPMEDFPRLVSSSEWLPCNEDYFNGTSGRYGRDGASFIYNGPFRITEWKKDESISLTANPNYHGQYVPLPAGVKFKIVSGENTIEKMIADGAIDAGVLSGEMYQKMNTQNCTGSFVEDTTWILFINPDFEFFGNIQMREAFLKSIDMTAFPNLLPEYLSMAKGFVPPRSKVENQFYRETVGSVVPNYFGAVRAKTMLESAMKALEIESVPTIDLYCPNDKNVKKALASLVELWKNNLSVYVNIIPLDSVDLQKKIDGDGFAIAVLPMRPEGSTAADAIDMFASGGKGNPIRNMPTEVNDAIALVDHVKDDGQTIKLAEQKLLESYTAFPLFMEKRAFVLFPGVTGVDIFPFNEGVDFIKAGKIKVD